MSLSDHESGRTPTCSLCGKPMPPGEEMFKFHGYSGPCPKPTPKEPAPSPVEPAGAAPEGREHPMTERAKKVATLEITLRARYDVQTGRMVGLGVETPNAQGWHPRVTGSYMSTADRVFPAKLPRAAARIAKKG